MNVDATLAEALDEAAKVKPGPTPASQAALKRTKTLIRLARREVVEGPPDPPPPTEEPPPPPPADGGKVLFVDHFTTVPAPHKSAGGWYGQYNADRTFSTAAGTRFEVRQGDAEADTKLQLAQVSGQNHSAGEDLWVADRFIFPAAFYSATAPWEVVHEWHDGSNEGLTGGSFSPPVGIFHQGGRLLLKNGKGSPTYWTSAFDVAEDVWYEVVYRVKFAKSDGIIEVWIKGEKAAEWHGLTTNTGKNYLKVGPYRGSGSSGTSACQHSKLAIATSRAAAEAA